MLTLEQMRDEAKRSHRFWLVITTLIGLFFAGAQVFFGYMQISATRESNADTMKTMTNLVDRLTPRAIEPPDDSGD